MRKLLGWIRALRPKQWTKNALVFAGLIFGHQFQNSRLILTSVGAFVLFCALSSSIYLINDVCDIEEDRKHPRKCNRPFAAGILAPSTGIVSSLVLMAVALSGFFSFNLASGLIALSYVVLQFAYSLRLKHVVILDLLCVSLGFVIRAAIGATAIRVVISPWLLVCTILLALFLTMCKRRQELQAAGPEAVNQRPILGEYSPYLLDQMIAVVTASTLTSYCVYTMSDRTVRELGTDKLIYTIPFVLYGIFRYLYLVHQREAGEAPDQVLLTDAPLLLDVVLYGVTVLAILALK
jgi:4-hydroxybenzoate polyprenyltransferase